jgi:ribosome biogenesis protein Nip4
MIKEFLKKIKKEDIINHDNTIKIEDGYFLKPEEETLKKNFNKVSRKTKENKLKYTGISLGCNRKKIFAPSVYLLEKLRDQNANYIKINKKGEWLFICGRDIQGTSIYKTNCEINEYAIVLNLKKEPLGYGILIKKPTGDSMCFKRIYDIGDYLRRERQEKNKKKEQKKKK